MNKFCTKCGESIPKEAKFCPKCGESLGDIPNIVIPQPTTSEKVTHFKEKIESTGLSFNDKKTKFLLIGVVMLVLGGVWYNTRNPLSGHWKVHPSSSNLFSNNVDLEIKKNNKAIMTTKFEDVFEYKTETKLEKSNSKQNYVIPMSTAVLTFTYYDADENFAFSDFSSENELKANLREELDDLDEMSSNQIKLLNDFINSIKLKDNTLTFKIDMKKMEPVLNEFDTMMPAMNLSSLDDGKIKRQSKNEISVVSNGNTMTFIKAK